LTLKNPVVTDSYQLIQFIDPIYGTVNYPSASQQFYIQPFFSPALDIGSNYNVWNTMSPKNPLSSSSDWKYAIFGSAEYIDYHSSKVNS
jgi:hypothetical protein